MRDNKEIDFFDYKKSVQNNIESFKSLDLKLQEYTKQFQTISKIHYGNKKIFDFYEEFSELDYHSISEVIEELINSTYKKCNNKVYLQSILWFIYFDPIFESNLSKDTFDSFITEKAKFLSSSETPWYRIGFQIDRRTNYLNLKQTGYITKRELLNGFKREDPIQRVAVDWVLSNIEFFPTSLKTTFDKISKNIQKTMSKLENEFQLKIYVRSLPDKLTKTFVQKELSKFDKNYSYRDSALRTYSYILFFKGLIHKYTLQELIKNKYILDTFYKKLIVRTRDMQTLNEKQKQILFDDDIQKLLSLSIYDSIGFETNNINYVNIVSIKS